MIRILIVEPEKEQTQRITAALRNNGYTVFIAQNEKEALNILDSNSIQLMIANSVCGGIALTAELRAAGAAVPVIVTTENTARSEIALSSQKCIIIYYGLKIETFEVVC